MALSLRMDQREAIAEDCAHTVLAISCDRKSAAALGAVECEGGNDKHSTRPQCPSDRKTIGCTVTLLVEKVKDRAVVAEIVSGRFKLRRQQV